MLDDTLMSLVALQGFSLLDITGGLLSVDHGQSPAGS
jgi:hypothetical protein